MVGLDPAAIKELKKVILELKDGGATVLISTHMLEMVKELWDVTFVMEKGHIIGTYSKEMVGAENLEDLFFQVTEGGQA
jgi:ABC-2 type transport system ATP-binding protein